MNQPVRVPFPEDWEEFDLSSDADREALVDHFNSFVEGDDGDAELREALDLNSAALGARQIVDSVCVTDVELKGRKIGVHCRVEWSEYQACKDMPGFDSEDQWVVGCQTSTGWEFTRRCEPEPRNTHEEF